MKNDFHGHYTPSANEFETLWNDAEIIVDTNVLLNLYTYSISTSDEILALLGKFSERIWLPHQVAAEYHKNRSVIILKESKRYKKILKDLEAVGKALHSRKEHPHVTKELVDQFDLLEIDIKSSLEKGEKQHRDLISTDPIRDQVTKLFDQRVGPAKGDDELKMLYKEGEIRYAHKTPPGYCDLKKLEPDRYGDLVIWQQLIDYTTTSQKPVIFVTDDLKEDWWEYAEDQRVGPRPELRHEFLRKTERNIHIYTTDSFVKTATKRGNKISSNATKEITTASIKRQLDVTEARMAWLKFAKVDKENLLRAATGPHQKEQEKLVSQLKAAQLREAVASYHNEQEKRAAQLWSANKLAAMAAYQNEQQAFEEATADDNLPDKNQTDEQTKALEE